MITKELLKSKPKRGAAYMASGYPVWLYRIIKENLYLVCYDQNFSLGADYVEINPSNLLPVRKLRKPIGNNKKSPTPEEKRFRADLNVFYAEALNVIPDKCQECGEDLGCLSAWDARCCTAHILPKSKKQGFPSIACHPANRMFLGKKNCSCHTRYDDRDGKFRSTMKIYPAVLAAFEILKEYLTDKEIVKAKKYLNIKS